VPNGGGSSYTDCQLKKFKTYKQIGNKKYQKNWKQEKYQQVMWVDFRLTNFRGSFFVYDFLD